MKGIKMSTATAVTDRIQAGVYDLDKGHSSAEFAVQHAGISLFRGKFTDLDAKLVVGDDVELTGVVKVDSIDVADENIRPHLLSPEFFDVERNPEVRFSSTDLSIDGDEVRLVGELEIAGNARPVEARGSVRGPVALPGGAEKVALAFETAIDRTEFGMDWQMDLPGGEPALANDVTLSVELELNRG
jgi:polyisoprenoid-binding protein YceI